jgi:hypothetical protein
MKTQLKVIALSVLVATSVHAKESKENRKYNRNRAKITNLVLRKIIEKCKAFLKKANGKLLMKTTSKPHLSV